MAFFIRQVKISGNAEWIIIPQKLRHDAPNADTGMLQLRKDLYRLVSYDHIEMLFKM